MSWLSHSGTMKSEFKDAGVAQEGCNSTIDRPSDPIVFSSRVRGVLSG